MLPSTKVFALSMSDKVILILGFFYYLYETINVNFLRQIYFS